MCFFSDAFRDVSSKEMSKDVDNNFQECNRWPGYYIFERRYPNFMATTFVRYNTVCQSSYNKREINCVIWEFSILYEFSNSNIHVHITSTFIPFSSVQTVFYLTRTSTIILFYFETESNLGLINTLVYLIRDVHRCL